MLGLHTSDPVEGMFGGMATKQQSILRLQPDTPPPLCVVELAPQLVKCPTAAHLEVMRGPMQYQLSSGPSDCVSSILSFSVALLTLNCMEEKGVLDEYWYLFEIPILSECSTLIFFSLERYLVYLRGHRFGKYPHSTDQYYEFFITSE